MLFETLNNFRDLGGLTGFGGRRIKSGRLMRSAQLATASDADLEILADILDTVVDFAHVVPGFLKIKVF
ncbi:MAG: tyrosine-protein phosphatase, partial [Firmicutes bacterium]|nr:tyrosine-protein phosphatase [Bacillota bacterium]